MLRGSGKVLGAIGTAVMVTASAVWLLDRFRGGPADLQPPPEQRTVDEDEPAERGDIPTHVPAVDKPRGKPQTLEQSPIHPKSLVNIDVVPATSTPTLSLALDGDPGDAERLEATLVEAFSSPSLRLVIGLFKPAFKAQGFLRAAYDGDTEILARSGALAAVDRVLLGRVERSCGKSSELAADLVSCNVHLHYKTISRSGAIVSSGSVSVIGAGFSNDAARDRAIEVLVEQHGQRLITFN